MSDNSRNAEMVPAIVMRIQALKSSMSKSEKLVADYIIAHPEEVIYLSVSDLAERSNVSDATVVRTCQKLGMNGYQDLKVTLARDIVSPLQSIHEDISENDSPSAIIEKVFQSAIHTLQFTFDTLRTESILDAVDVLDKAKKVHIYGLGNSHSVVVDLQHKLLRLGIDVSTFPDSHLQITGACALREGDCVFAISHSGSSRDVVHAASIAKQHGAKVISLTAFGRSPLANIADVCLHTASVETQYRVTAISSRIAQLTIIDVLYTFIALRRKDVVSNFREIEKALEATKY